VPLRVKNKSYRMSGGGYSKMRLPERGAPASHRHTCRQNSEAPTLSGPSE
jgi:hypothetical protein